MLTKIVAVLLFMFASSVSATPLYYTFQGVVTGDGNNGFGSSGYNIGDVTEYTLLVDFDVNGEYSANGNTYYERDTDYFDYYFADYIAGDAISWSYNPYTELNKAFDNINENYSRLEFFVESWLNISFLDEQLSTLEVGDKGTFFDVWNDPDYMYITGDIELLSISPVYQATLKIAQISSPSTVLLMLIGLLSCSHFLKRKKKGR